MNAGNGLEKAKVPAPGSFDELVRKEFHELLSDRWRGEGSSDLEIAEPGSTGEPWVRYTSENLVGLALSGGGIRSATFNLGVLRSLEEWKVLRHVDYLATVSGGGYIGGFWTRWRARHRWPAPAAAAAAGTSDGPARSRAGEANQADAPRFPTTEAGPNGAASAQGRGRSRGFRESVHFRHLREFSRFLIPRRGLNSEFWTAAVTILSGLVPSLVTALASVVLITSAWALLAYWLIGSEQQVWKSTAIVGAIGLALLVSQSRTFATRDRHTFAPMAALALAVAGSAGGCLLWWTVGSGPAATPQMTVPTDGDFRFKWILLWPCLAPIGGLVVLSPIRGFMRRWNVGMASERRVDWTAAFDRAMATLFAIEVGWAVLAGLLEFSRWLVGLAGSGNTGYTKVGTGSVAAVFTLLFYRLRDWLKKPKEAAGGTWWAKAAQVLRPMIPQLLAGGIVVLLFLIADIYLVDAPAEAGGSDPVERWTTVLGVCLGIQALACVMFHPASVGLHEFYRARLVRCYLGAASDSPTQRWAEETADDMPLHEDEGRPVHLVCCAANQCGGDPMSTLHRGARSAVLSRHGVAVGDHYVADTKLRLSTAITASAAALNSMMGEFNVTMGRAVPFVMTALNMRLGCWLRNPAVPLRGRARWIHGLFCAFPGLFYLCEMAGRARCDIQGGSQPFMHLSDGGHFENLALYELIRRHCRYIIVSDAGEDRGFAFADLGRAVRRVRDDFGVEIDIELQSLQPDAQGHSRRHAAVGVIHYDGMEGTDKGMIVYLKPTLTGDEPVDVVEYHKAFTEFPHEPTRDQFFDEAQFESYRRLGQHIVDAVLDIGGDIDYGQVQSLFHELRMFWQDVPWMRTEGSTRLSEHAAELEDVIRGAHGTEVRREFFGDLLDAIERRPSARRVANRKTREAEVWLVLRILKFMEEALVTCELDDHWSNPRARSWMAYLQRYAAIPALREWWPALKPLLGAAFIHFADSHLFLGTTRADAEHQPCRIVLHPMRPEAASMPQPRFARRLRECFPAFPTEDRELFGLFLEWRRDFGGRPDMSIQVGMMAVRVRPIGGGGASLWQDSVASWGVYDVFVPPELGGGDNFRKRMVQGVIEHFEGRWRGVTRLEVELAGAGGPAAGGVDHLRRGKADRQERTEHVGMYRSLGFRFGAAGTGDERCMVREIVRKVPEPAAERRGDRGGPAARTGVPDTLSWNVPRPEHHASPNRIFGLP